jgi:preprotein translocase subunit SecE
MDNFKALFKEYWDELLYKVQWPSLDELQSKTVTVLIASIMIALAIALMDLTFNTVMTGLYSVSNSLF